MSKKPTKAQRRAQAVADRKRASEAAVRQRRNRFLLWGGLAVVVVAAIVVAVVAGGGGNGAKANSYETASVKVTGTPLPTFHSTTSPDPAMGDTIPQLQGKSVFDGKPLTIGPKTGGGEPQVILFVAHWCPHCQAEVPRLVQLAKQGVFDSVEVSAVATSTTKSADNYPPSAWLQRVKWPFPVMADSTSGTAAQAYGLSAFPYFVMVRADGTVAGRGTGELPPAEVTANVDALKAGKPLPLTSSSAASSSG